MAENLSNQSCIIKNFQSFQWGLNSIIFYRCTSTERARRAPKTLIVRVRIKNWKNHQRALYRLQGGVGTNNSVQVQLGCDRSHLFFQIKFRPSKSINHYREKTHNGLKIIFEQGPLLTKALFYWYSIRDHSSITSAKKWVCGARKWNFLLIYSTIYADVGGWA